MITNQDRDIVNLSTVTDWFDTMDRVNLDTWLRTFGDLQKPAPVLQLLGAPGSGKSLLVNGITRTWGQYIDGCGIHHYNSALFLSPVVVYDLHKRNAIKAYTKKATALAAKHSHYLRAKGKHPRVMNRSCRVIVMTDKPVCDTALTVNLPDADYLRSIDGNTIKQWVRTDISAYIRNLCQS